MKNLIFTVLALLSAILLLYMLAANGKDSFVKPKNPSPKQISEQTQKKSYPDIFAISWQDMTSGQKKRVYSKCEFIERYKNISQSEKAANEKKLNLLKTRWQKMSDSQKQAAWMKSDAEFEKKIAKLPAERQDGMKKRRSQVAEKWAAMSEAERMNAWIGRKNKTAKWESLPPEERNKWNDKCASLKETFGKLTQEEKDELKKRKPKVFKETETETPEER